jgi:hypothetical protein
MSPVCTLRGEKGVRCVALLQWESVTTQLLIQLPHMANRFGTAKGDGDAGQCPHPPWCIGNRSFGYQGHSKVSRVSWTAVPRPTTVAVISTVRGHQPELETLKAPRLLLRVVS